MYLAEKCADTYSYLDRNEHSKTYYLKQVNMRYEIYSKDGIFSNFS